MKKENNEPSVWYYYIVDQNGTPIEKKSWISLHRSQISGETALTGIFINTIDTDIHSNMPTGLKISK